MRISAALKRRTRAAAADHRRAGESFGGRETEPKGAALMSRALAGLAFAASLQVGAAWACTPLPYTLANGDLADATKVMDDFNGIISCPIFTGDLGIGTTAPTYTIDIVGNMRVTDGSGAKDAVILYGATFPALGTYNTGQSTDQHWAELGDYNGVFTGRFVNDAYTSGSNWLLVSRNSGTYTTQYVSFPSGNVGVGITNPGYTFEVSGSTWSTTGWSSASDGRLKQSITTIPDALSTIERLRGVEFYWRPPADRPVGKTLPLPLGEQQVGFVAQEVEQVVPEAVSKPADGSDGAYGVNEAKIVAILVEAVKEQQAEIASQGSEIAKLKAALGGAASAASAAGK